MRGDRVPTNAAKGRRSVGQSDSSKPLRDRCAGVSIFNNVRPARVFGTASNRPFPFISTSWRRANSARYSIRNCATYCGLTREEIMKSLVLGIYVAVLAGVGFAHSQPTPVPPGKHQLVMLSYLLADPRAGVGPAHAVPLGIFRGYKECKTAADDAAKRGPTDIAFKTNPGGTATAQLAIAFVCVGAP